MQEVEEVERKDIGDEVKRVVEQGGIGPYATVAGSGVGAGDGTGTDGSLSTVHCAGANQATPYSSLHYVFLYGHSFVIPLASKFSLLRRHILSFL